MKYPASHLTPFLSSLPENSHLLELDHSPICTSAPELNHSVSYCSELFVVAKSLNSFGIKQIQTLLAKHRGWGATYKLLATPLLPAVIFKDLRIPPPASSINMPRLFMQLQIHRRVNSFFSHPYRTPGVSPSPNSKPSLCPPCLSGKPQSFGQAFAMLS
jgi:hypothetical protein